MSTVANSVKAQIQDMQATVGLLQEELAATNREVMLLTLELEQRVAERTAELANSNQKLQQEVAERIRAETEIRKLNKDLENRAELLQTGNQELEAFSASVAHDLRNPLARILGYAELLNECSEEITGEDIRSYASRVSEAVLKTSALIDGLLRLSRSGQAELKAAAVDMNPLIAGVIEDLTAKDTPQIKWVRGELPAVFGDAALLRQAFVNLLSNAMKYSRRSNSPRIEIGTAETAPEEWTIFVQDNGVGFDPAKAGRLFGAFQRLHAESEFEGTGIGLANVRRIVLRHGGRVWAESQIGQGATFYVALPKQSLIPGSASPHRAA